MKPVVLIMLGAGTWLLYSAIANKQPLGVLANAVGYTSTNPSVTNGNSTAATPSTPTTPTSAAGSTVTNPATTAQQNALNQLLAGTNPSGPNYNGPILQS
jgi:hypothetical protein